MSAPFTHKFQEAWTRFTHGAFECTVVSDGPIHMGPPHPAFPDAAADEIDRLFNENFLPPDLTIEQNALVVNTGTHLVLFDTGCGALDEPFLSLIGPQVGRLISNLHKAGIDPADIDVVALTHGHPDHAWGLVDAAGKPQFPNARVAIDPRELKQWTDLSVLSTPEGETMDPVLREFLIGAHKNLIPYVDQGRILLVEDKTELVPGITAISTQGHTPGHTSYRIESEGQTLVVWGDVCHHQVLTLEYPKWAYRDDMDSPEAIQSRQRILAEVARDRLTVLAYHFPFPGRGHVTERDGRYRWLPAPLQLEF